MELFRLFGSIMINDDKAIETLNNAEKSAKESANQLNNLSKKAGEMGKAVALGVTAAVGSLGAMVMKSVEATDRIDKMSQKLGMSAKGFQEWDYILGQNGIEIDSLQGGIKTLTNMTDELSKGSKTATESFGRLGITMEDLKGKTQEEIFNLTIERLQGVTDETERAAIANDLLGRSGSELAPLLNAGADSVEQLKQRAHELGLVLDEDAIQAGVVLGDTMDDVKASFGNIVTQIGVEVMPMFQGFLDWVIANMPVIKEVAGGIFRAIGDSIQWVIDNSNWLIPILTGLLASFVAFQVVSFISGLMAAWSAITAGAAAAGGLLNAVMLAFPGTWIALAIAAVIAAIVALIMNFDKVKEAGMVLWDKMKEIFGGIGSFIKDIFDKIRGWIKIPSISIEGSLNPLDWLKNGIPKFNVNWNAEGGIFDKPTIFATRYGFQGVGEAGPEAIMPLSKLDSMLSERQTIDYDLLGIAVKQALQGMVIELDKKPVGEFVDKMIIKGAYK